MFFCLIEMILFMNNVFVTFKSIHSHNLPEIIRKNY